MSITKDVEQLECRSRRTRRPSWLGRIKQRSGSWATLHLEKHVYEHQPFGVALHGMPLSFATLGHSKTYVSKPTFVRILVALDHFRGYATWISSCSTCVPSTIEALHQREAPRSYPALHANNADDPEADVDHASLSNLGLRTPFPFRGTLHGSEKTAA